MKKIYILLIILSAVQYACSQKNNIDLEKINLGFKPKEHITPFNKKHNKVADKMSAFWKKKNKTNQDTIEYKKNRSLSLELLHFKVDTLYLEKQKYGLKYSSTMNSNYRVLAHFNKMLFYKLDFIESLNGDFISLATETYHKPNPVELKKLMTNFSDKFGPPKIRKSEWKKEYRSYEWQSEKIIYTLFSRTKIDNFNTKLPVTLFLTSKKYNTSLKNRRNIEGASGLWIGLYTCDIE